MNASSVSTTDGWVDQPDGRGTLDILWTCFFTIFVCTWTIQHPNVPSPDEHDQRAKWLLRKFRWAMLTVLVPEVVTASAFAQHTAACNSVEAIAAKTGEKQWTMRHAFYVNMGGIVLKPRDGRVFPINATHLRFLVDRHIMSLPNITAQEIWDKSKADGFAKLFACGQIGWMAVQLVARAVQGLAITPLEIATIAFAIPSLATYILWFHKPTGVDVPTYIRLDETVEELLTKLGQAPNTHWDQTPLDFVSKINSPSFTSEIILELPTWPNKSNLEGPATRIRNDVFGLKYRKRDQMLVGGVWLAFGGIHLTAWSFSFPSYTELLLWRISSLILAGSMLMFWITGNRKTYVLVGFIWPKARRKVQEISNERKKVSTIQIILGTVTGLMYIGARLCLIVQVFVALRKNPIGTFETVDWVKFLPHLGL